MKPWLIIAVFMLALGAAGAGYVKGRADNEAKHTAVLAEERQAALTASEAGRKKEADRLAEVAANQALTQALEDQAYADPVVVADCMPAGSRLRLEARVRAANGN